MNILEPHDYAVLDVENLRPHYARTLEHWLERFEASGQRVSEMYGDWFRRAWRLYLAIASATRITWGPGGPVLAGFNHTPWSVGR